MFFLARGNEVFFLDFIDDKPELVKIFESEEGNIICLYSFCGDGDEQYVIKSSYPIFVATTESRKTYICTVDCEEKEVIHKRLIPYIEDAMNYSSHPLEIDFVVAFYRDRLTKYHISDEQKDIDILVSSVLGQNLTINKLVYRLGMMPDMVLSNNKVYGLDTILDENEYFEGPIEVHEQCEIYHCDKWALYESGYLCFNDSGYNATNVSKVMSAPGFPRYYLSGDSLYVEKGRKISEDVTNFHVSEMVYLLKNDELFYIEKSEEISTGLKGNIVLPVTCNFDIQQQFKKSSKRVKRSIS